jgi:hypothetical protein
MLRIIIIRKIINIDMMYIIDEEVIKNIILSFRLNIQIFIIIFLFHKSDKKKKIVRNLYETIIFTKEVIDYTIYAFIPIIYINCV